MSDCLFCKIAADEIPSDRVYEDDRVIVFRDIYPKASVHLLMIPRRHIDSLATVTDEDRDLLGYMLAKAPDIARDAGLDGGFRTIINTGADGGQEVFHIHLHILGGSKLPFA